MSRFESRLIQIRPSLVIRSSICLSLSTVVGATSSPYSVYTLQQQRQQKPAFVSRRIHLFDRQRQSSSLLGTVSAVGQTMSDKDNIRQRKQTLRKEVRKSIKATYPPSENEKLERQSNLVFSRLFGLPQYQSARSIGFFLSMPSGEIQTRDAIRKIVSDGKTLYVPRVGLDFERCDMDLVKAIATQSTDDVDNGQIFYDAWPKNKWNIPEPPVNGDDSNIAQTGDIDLLLVPGLAFDTNGHRLGQGKGYYDRFISKMRDTKCDEMKSSSTERAKPFLVGVCLEEQFLSGDGFEGIPVTDHDFIMDMVITPTKIVNVKEIQSA